VPCPYLTQVTMVYCRASPVRKLIPSDRVTTASVCDGDCFHACPAYLEAREPDGARRPGQGPPAADGEGALP
jgi:hypothetical protein